MLNLRGANTMGQSTESTVRRGMGVAADDCHARQSSALLWTYDVHDTLALIRHLQLEDTKFGAVFVQSANLNLRKRILNPL